MQTEIGRRQGGKGTGLGLALVRQIVQLSRGRLGVDSKIGKGTTIWFEIPYTLGNASSDLDPEDPMELSCASGDTAVSTTLSQAETLTNGNSPISKTAKAEDDQENRQDGYTAEQILISGPPDADGVLTPTSLRKANSRRPSLHQSRTRSDNSRKHTESPLPISAAKEPEPHSKIPQPTLAPSPPPVPADTPTPTALPKPDGSAGDGLNVLVVDDDKYVLLTHAWTG